MNIANSLRPHYVFPGAAFVPFPTHCGPYLEYRENASYSLNSPSLDPEAGGIVHQEWEIYGASFGVQYSAFPKFVRSLPPQRVSVRIPDQTQWPRELWSPLQARDSVHMNEQRLSALGISRHLSKALTAWSSRTKDFEEQYRQLPFGSIIQTEELKAKPEDMEFRFTSKAPLTPRLFSAKALQDMWGFQADLMPKSVPYDQLRFEKPLASTIDVVTVQSDANKTPMIFKSNPSSANNLYHELKVLLTIPPHPNIVKRPLYLVTMYSDEHQEDRVCGFLLEYYEQGTLDDILPKRRLENRLTLAQQVKWAKDITTALMHISSSPGQFYSDLRMDNVVLSKSKSGLETAVIIDFEQSRNIYNWAPPEIYYVEWLAELGDDNFARHDLSLEVLAKYSAILNKYLESRSYPIPLRVQGQKYDNPPHGWYFPWIASSPEEREAGQVYLLGKALWCLFEGVGDADIVLGRSNPYEAEQRFPEFKRTPERLRDFIKKCTAGAREWKDGPIAIYRRGGQIFPLGKTGLNGEPEGTVEEAKEVIFQFWRKEMVKAEAFVTARERYDKGEATDEDMEWLDYLKRPTLAEVMQTLEGLAKSML